MSCFSLKCILKKAKGTKKHLKRTKNKESKKSKLFMLDNLCKLFFMSLNAEKIEHWFE